MMFCFIVFAVGMTLGLFIGAAVAFSSRFEMMGDLEDAEADIDVLRARG